MRSDSSSSTAVAYTSATRAISRPDLPERRTRSARPASRRDSTSSVTARRDPPDAERAAHPGRGAGEELRRHPFRANWSAAVDRFRDATSASVEQPDSTVAAAAPRPGCEDRSGAQGSSRSSRSSRVGAPDVFRYNPDQPPEVGAGRRSLRRAAAGRQGWRRPTTDSASATADAQASASWGRSTATATRSSRVGAQAACGR